jgi:uncharacterized membrane protein (UPF0136 family)
MSESVMPESTKHPALELSLPQLVAGAVAAATATILSSRLDLMGTVLGAVLASIVSAIVAASVAGWWHRMREARDWVPQRIKGTLVGLGALALLVVAFHTGVDLLTADLPQDTFAARWLSEVGLS